MLTLIEASSTHKRPAAIQRAETVRHEDERGRTEQCAREEVGAAATERTPGTVAGMADDGLDDQSGKRRGEPENRNLIGFGAEIFVDGAHVGHLQAPSKLDAEEAKTHIPDLPEVARRLVH